MHKYRGWIYLLLFLVGFSLATIVGSLVGRKEIALIEALDPELILLGWLMLIPAPFFGYLVFRFVFVSARTVEMFRWLAHIIIWVSLGSIAGHAAYWRLPALTFVPHLSHVLVGIGALQACQHVERRGDSQAHGSSLSRKFRAKAMWFIGSRYFIVLFALAQCISAGLCLQAMNFHWSVILLGMAASLPAGAFSAAVVAWLVRRSAALLDD